MAIDIHHAALVALARRASPRRAAELLDAHRSPRQALEHLLCGGQLSLDSAPEADVEIVLAVTLGELHDWDAAGMKVVTVLDADYPPNLRTARDRPLVLMVQGCLSSSDDRAVAVVGTRRATSAGLRQASEIADAVVRAGWVVVSGLAAGIDTAAHRAALDGGGRTIAVIGTGLRHAFPKENAELQARLGREHAVISQFWPDQGPRRHTFPMRTALMAGLACATVVVEAPCDSGARMQARLALENGRSVLLLSSLVREHEWARQFAERPGVCVIDTAADVVARVSDLGYSGT